MSEEKEKELCSQLKDTYDTLKSQVVNSSEIDEENKVEIMTEKFAEIDAEFEEKNENFEQSDPKRRSI